MDGASDNHQTRQLTLAWTQAQPTVRLFIRSLVRDHQHVEDLTQEVAMTLLDRYGEYDCSRSFTGWALGIARNKVMNYWTRQGRERHVFDQAAMERLADAHQVLLQTSESRRDALTSCLQKLSERDRRLIEQHYQQSQSPQSLAVQLRTTVNAIYIRLCRIRLALLDCVKKTLQAAESQG
jgi:RNA polymerase sigma-70 factor (ECF subfamily)